MEQLHPTAIDEPYALLPEDATQEQVDQYLANFATALATHREAQELDAPEEERNVKEWVSTYLFSSFDPRSLEEIEADARFILADKME